MVGPASDVLQVGSRFGAYEVKECIGSGAMGQVYRAEHCLLHKTVALKVMASSVRLGHGGHLRFLREARAAAAIKHPHVVDILDVGVLDGTPFIIMEFLDGMDLESHLQRHGYMSTRDVADLALPIIAALGAVHDAGVIHRDIKPSNIFLSRGVEEDVVPKILDFGISKALGALDTGSLSITGPTELLGTPLYISPEALIGAEHVTARSDQYALGVVLYECATGRTPFEGSDFNRLILEISSRTPEAMRSIRPSIAPELEAAVSRAMSREPEQRFEHIRELGVALWELASERVRYRWAKRFAPPGYVEDERPQVQGSPIQGGPRWRPAATASAVAIASALLATFLLVRVRPPSSTLEQSSAAAVLPLHAEDVVRSPAPAPGQPGVEEQQAQLSVSETQASEKRGPAPAPGPPPRRAAVGPDRRSPSAALAQKAASRPPRAESTPADQELEVLLPRRTPPLLNEQKSKGLVPGKQRTRPATATGPDLDALAGTNQSPILD